MSIENEANQCLLSTHDTVALYWNENTGIMEEMQLLTNNIISLHLAKGLD